MLSIFNLSGGTAQSGRSHCSIQAEPLLNFAGRGDFAERCTHVATSISIATIIDEYLEVANTITLTDGVETLVLQNVLGWLHSEHLDLRCIATRILLALARNQENKSIVDRQLVNMIDGDCVYIKNLIMRRINKSKGVSDSVKEYIMNKCKSDPNYVVRMVCSEEMRAYPQ